MEKRALPVIVTTYEAFCSCLTENVRVIYVCRELYASCGRKICKDLEENGYELVGYPARQGMLYTKGVDIAQCAVLDPYCLF